MDGTIFNSFTVSYDAIREGFEKFWAEVGVEGPVPPWDEVKKLIGLPSYEFYPAVLPEEYRDRWELLHKRVGDAETRRLRDGSGRTFDGVDETLSELADRGYKLLCLTNASERYFDAVMDGCSLRGYFEEIIGLGAIYSKNKVDVLREWVIEYGGTESIIYVGDRKADIDAARAAGIGSIGVTWGYGSPEELSQADVVIDLMIHLLDCLTPMDRKVCRSVREILELKDTFEEPFIVNISNTGKLNTQDLIYRVAEELGKYGLTVKVSKKDEVQDIRMTELDPETLILVYD